TISLTRPAPISAAGWEGQPTPANPTSGPWPWPNRNPNAASCNNAFANCGKKDLPPLSICCPPERLSSKRGDGSPHSQGEDDEIHAPHLRRRKRLGRGRARAVLRRVHGADA